MLEDQANPLQNSYLLVNFNDKGKYNLKTSGYTTYGFTKFLLVIFVFKKTRTSQTKNFNLVMTYLLALSPLSLANDKEFKKLEFQTPSNKTNSQTRKLLEPVFPRFVEHSDLYPPLIEI